MKKVYIFVYIGLIFGKIDIAQKIWDIPESNEIEKIEETLSFNPADTPDLIVTLKSDKLNSDQQRIAAQISKFPEVSDAYLLTSANVPKK